MTQVVKLVKNHANVRNMSSRLGLTIPESPQRRPAGDQLKNYVKAVAVVGGAVFKSNRVNQKSNAEDDGLSDFAAQADAATYNHEFSDCFECVFAMGRSLQEAYCLQDGTSRHLIERSG